MNLCLYVILRGGGIGSLYTFIDEFMTSHPEAGGIGVNWCIFGSNGHITKPEGGVLENYTRRSEDDFPNNKHIKTICDPMKVLAVHHVHYPFYRRGFLNLDENGRTITGPFTETVSFSKIRINHYFGKSLEEFKAKRARGRATADALKPMSDFDWHDRNDVPDTEILSHR